MKWESLIYTLLKYYNDYKAIKNGKIAQRIGRRVTGKITGRLMGKLFK